MFLSRKQLQSRHAHYNTGKCGPDFTRDCFPGTSDNSERGKDLICPKCGSAGPYSCGSESFRAVAPDNSYCDESLCGQKFDSAKSSPASSAHAPAFIATRSSPSVLLSWYAAWVTDSGASLPTRPGLSKHALTHWLLSMFLSRKQLQSSDAHYNRGNCGPDFTSVGFPGPSDYSKRREYLIRPKCDSACPFTCGSESSRALAFNARKSCRSGFASWYAA